MSTGRVRLALIRDNRWEIKARLGSTIEVFPLGRPEHALQPFEVRLESLTEDTVLEFEIGK